MPSAPPLPPSHTLAWRNLFVTLNQDDPAQVSTWVRQNKGACTALRAAATLNHPLAKPVRRFWEGLLDRGWLPQAQDLFDAVNKALAAEFMVDIMVRLPDPRFRRLEQVLRRKVHESEVFEAAAVLGRTDVLTTLLTRGPQPNGLSQGLLRAMRRGDTAVGEWLWPHVQAQHAWGQIHVEEALQSGQLEWFDRFRPQMTRAWWSAALFALLDDLPMPREHQRALLHEGMSWFSPESDTPDHPLARHQKTWLDQWLSAAVERTSPWLSAAVARYPATSPTTEAFTQAARAGAFLDALAPLAGQADWTAVKKALLPRHHPRWDLLDRLSSQVPQAVLQAWVAQHPERFPHGQARLRELQAHDQAPAACSPRMRRRS